MSVLRKLAGSRFFVFCLAMLLLESQAYATTILNSMPFTFVNGTAADASQVNANFAQIVTQTNANAAGSGSNNDITALNALATPFTQAQGGNVVYLAGTSTGSANAQATAVTTPTGWTLVSGKRVVFPAGFTNTGPTTLAVNGGAAANVFKTSPTGLVALAGNEIIAGNTVEATYDGVEFVLLNQNLLTTANTWPQQQTYSKAMSQAKGAVVASAATTDIFTPGDGNLVHISGVATITSLGTAPQAGAERTVIFDGILTLTHNAVSLILPGAANITTAVGDRMIVRADTTANMSVIAYTRANGMPVYGPVMQYLQTAAINTTAGTNVDYTTVPSWAKKVTVSFNGVSTNGVNFLLAEIGNATPETTGYLSAGTNFTASSSSVAGFIIESSAAANLVSGQMVLVQVSANVWIESHTLSYPIGTLFFVGAGSKTTAAAVTVVRLTTVGGTDTFDAGSYTITFEG
jgi:hypothetical protein